MDDLLTEFLTETFESLDVVDVELVKLEKEPSNKSVLDNIFRLVHTIKGTCGFLGLPRLEAVAHASENVLGKFRDGVLEVTPDCVTLILQSIDQIKDILGYLEANETEPTGDDTDLISNLALASEGRFGENIDVEDDLVVDVALGRPLMPGEVSLDDLEAAFRNADGPDSDDDVEEDVVAVEESAPEPEVVAEAAPAQDEPSGGELAPTNVNSVANQSIRVNVGVLEDLMTMVSELVLTRNQLLQMVRHQEDSEFKVPLQRLSNVTSDLQEAVMKTRMQPIGNAWQKLPRIIRDLSRELDKKIELEMVGADTELDRQVLELIKDPLTHMVRNSADHGLETTAERLAAGKPAVGKVVLKAYHEGGHIIIEVGDDGKGLNTEVISKKLKEKGLVTDLELERMSEAQIHKFIFHAGFSTATKVTNVSGRGVGMDVVRTNIEVIGGSIDLKSTEGKGTVFTIKIPLTLAIVSALIVEDKGQKYAIPQLSVVELVRTKADSEYVIEKIDSTPVLRLRDRLLPLVYLSDLLDSHEFYGEPENEGEEKATKADENFIIVAQIGSQTFGVVVDGVHDTEEIVVKPVASVLREISLYSGNTILGDGSVIMILDPNGLAGHISAAESDKQNQEEQKAVRSADNDDAVSMLIFKAGSDEPKAVPLSLVTRLEELELDTIEYSNGRNVVQYRGNLMPLVNVSPMQQLKTEGRQPILVFADNGRAIGLVVDEIVDIVDEKLQIELTSGSSEIMGTAVIRDHATEIVDVSHYLTQGHDDWFSFRQEGEQAERKRILLVEDSPFFQHLISPLLRSAGYDVLTASSADEALELCEAGEDFDLIVSDIEMPGTNGLEFASQLREDEKWNDVPFVALTSRDGIEDIEATREAGFVEHVSKSDRDRLLMVLGKALGSDDQAA